MHGTVDATILTQNIFIVYHLNFGIVLTGVLCSSKRLQSYINIMYQASLSSAQQLAPSCAAAHLSCPIPHPCGGTVTLYTVLSLKGRSDLNYM